MRHSTSRDSANRHGNVYMRGKLIKADDTQLMQMLQLTGYSGEAQQAIEYAESYGFTSVPKGPSQQQGGGQGGQGGGGGGVGGLLGGLLQNLGAAAEHFTSQINSGRSHGVTSAVPDRRYRLFKKQEGEVAQYDDQGQWLYMQRSGTLMKTPNSKTITLQVDQEQQQNQQGQQGGGGGQQGGGQQQYGQDATQVPKPVTSITMTKDTVTISGPNGKTTITLTKDTITITADKIVLDGKVYLGGSDANQPVTVTDQPTAMKVFAK